MELRFPPCLHQIIVGYAEASMVGHLMAACREGRTRSVQLLLNLGLTIDAIRSDECKALQYASEGGHEPIVQLLLGAGLTAKDVCCRNHYALQMAHHYGHRAVVRLLREHSR